MPVSAYLKAGLFVVAAAAALFAAAGTVVIPAGCKAFACSRSGPVTPWRYGLCGALCLRGPETRMEIRRRPVGRTPCAIKRIQDATAEPADLGRKQNPIRPTPLSDQGWPRHLPNKPRMPRIDGGEIDHANIAISGS